MTEADDRSQARGLERRDQRRHQRQRHRDARDQEDLLGPHADRQPIDQIDLGIELVAVAAHDRAGRDPERDADDGADRADHAADHREHHADLDRRRAHRLEDRDLAGLVGHQHRQRRHHVHGRDADDDRQHQEQHQLLRGERLEQVVVELVPVLDLERRQWMKLLEQNLGKAMFDSCMHEYFRRWQFKHPYPEDFKKVLEDVSGKNVDAEFALLNKKGKLPEKAVKKDTKFTSLFNFKDTDKHHYIFAAPAIGANIYDKLMLGVLIHNYTLPAEKFQFLVSPMYAIGSKQLNGLGRISYHWYPGIDGQKIEISLSGETYNGNDFTDSNNNKKAFRFSKIVPSVKYIFANKNSRSSITKFIQWKTFFINEQYYISKRDTILQQNNITYPTASRYLNQLKFVIENSRVLYPYKGELLAEQGEGFLRVAFTGNYFFNYAKEGGMNVRLFAGKFFYMGDNTFLKQAETDAYHLNMSGPKGFEDYTYSNYFAGRNKFSGFTSQQIMNRDGFFKVRTDLLSSKVGKTDNWLAAANFTTDVPKAINILQILPIKIPLKAFVDIGTYAEAWQKNAETGKFIYDAGLQISFFKDILKVYFPILYSKVYRDYFKSTITEKRFVKNISFSIDIQNLSLKKLAPQLTF